MIFYIKFLFLLIIVTMTACSTGPKKVLASSEDSAKSSGIFSETSSSEPNTNTSSTTNQPFADDLHTVIVNEVLPTSKYVYLNVNEGNEQFWIATSKQEVVEGATYFYRGGLLKTNFESKEYNRTFDRIYLVSNLVSEMHGNNSGTLNNTGIPPNLVEIPQTQATQAPIREGSIKIADLVKNPQKYDGKTIQISGKCTKVNPNIMNRNWIHLKDGSKDEFDLVITSSAFVQEGTVITISAVVRLNQDFGAGYKYDLILENGVVVP